MGQANHLYAIAIGSNRRHVLHGRPSGVVSAAISELERRFSLFDASRILINPATGGAGRDFANAVALVTSPEPPDTMLAQLKALERSFGRRPGRRWGARVLDLDIVAWDGPPVRTRTLTIPHPRLLDRAFVLAPLVAVAPHWKVDANLSAVQHLYRLGKLTRGD